MVTLPTPVVVVRDPVLRFLLLAGALYVGWYLLYSFWLHPHSRLDRLLVDNLAWISGGVLELLGYELLPDPGFDNNRYIGVQGGHHLWIGDACNGAGLFAVYIIFLLAYPGPWRAKAWFAILGLLSIHVINALRIAALAIIVSIDWELLSFNHDYTFYIVVYGWVFLLWFIWIKRFSVRPAAV